MQREIRIGELPVDLGIPQHRLTRMADAGTIPSVRTDGGHRRQIVPISPGSRGSH